MRKVTVTAAAIALVALVGAIDYLTGQEVRTSLLFLIPICFVTWWAGRWAGIVASFASAAVLFVSDHLTHAPYSDPWAPYWNAAVRLGVALTITFFLSFLKKTLKEIQGSYVHLRELEAVRDDLAHMLVHDLRSPLTVISDYLQAVGKQGTERLPEQEKEYLERALVRTSELTDAVTSILDVSRLEAAKMPLRLTPCDIRDIARQAIDRVLFPHERNLAVLDVGREPAMATCDKNMIRRAIGNLVSNAASFTPKDGQVRVRVESSQGTVKVIVADGGPGIPPQFQATLFEKFGQVEDHQSRGRASTGMGLMFCKLAVEAHGGEIGVESQAGKGSKFWFVLPK